MRVSVALNHGVTPEVALGSVRQAETAGMSGVFVYDHLWQLGRYGTPAYECLTMLAAVAATTARMRVGTLVVRAGLRPEAVTLAGLLTVAAMVPGRLVVGLGSGDHLNEEENRRFGIRYGKASERLAQVGTLAQDLAAAGIEVWIGGRGRLIRTLCAELGLTWNVWGASDAEMRTMLAEVPQASVTWAGMHAPPQFSVEVAEAVWTGWRPGAAPT